MSIESVMRVMHYGRQSLRAWRRTNTVARALGWPRPVGNPLAARKNSSTLFILGSGASVSTYSEREWSSIASGDSLGFNYWTLHPFVPSTYMFEMPPDEEGFTRIVHNLTIRTDYRKVQVHIKDVERCADPAEVVRRLVTVPSDIRPLQIVWDAELPEGAADKFSEALVLFDRLGGFSRRGPWAAPRNRASVFLAVNLAVRAGYESIVLCGVDLNNTEYFFRMPGFPMLPLLQPPPPDQFGSVHLTNDPDHGEMTISVLLDVLDREILQKRSVKLFVAKRSSALHPRFPSYFE